MSATILQFPVKHRPRPKPQARRVQLVDDGYEARVSPLLDRIEAALARRDAERSDQ